MEQMKSAAEPGEDPRGAAEDAENDSAARLQAVVAERDLLATEKAGLQDRILRLQAEFENFRRRVEREKGEILEFANAETVRSLLPILDDFERALKTESADKEYARGMELIYQRLFDAMKKLGLEPIMSAGETFDPHIHHAVEMMESDEHEDHAILDEYQRGYNFRGKMLRPAMVKVAVRKS